jgi:hypothetical protein
MYARRRRIIITIAAALVMTVLAILQGPTGTTAAEETKAAATGTPTRDNATLNYAKITDTPGPR